MRIGTRIFLYFLGIVVLLGFACRPPKKGREAASGCSPYDLKVDVNDRAMTVAWKSDCGRLIAGYNIYISEKPLVEAYPGSELPSSIKPFNNAVFAGDTEPNDRIEHFIATRLDNGVKYYVSVRTVFPDRTLSGPSDEIVAVCGPRGEIELSVRYQSDHDGFSFETNSYVRADNIANDLYFYTKDGRDYLVSPSRLDGFLRTSRLRLLPFKGEFDDVKKRVARLASRAFEDRLIVEKGSWIWLTTPENYSALIRVLDISDQAEKRRIKLFFAFSALAGEPLF